MVLAIDKLPARTLVWLAIACSAGAATACRKRTSETAPSASREPSEVPAGFHRVVAAGWSMALPEGFTPAPSTNRSNQTFLIHERNDSAPGAPRLLFARHTKPAEFPSKVFGLTALDGLNRKDDKQVLSSRQHRALDVDVTDIEVLVGTSPNARIQWRRLFVRNNIAYTLTYSVAEAEAQRHRATAQTVLDSLQPLAE
jgi:hypothetical protein